MRVAVLRCQNLPRFVTWEIPNVEELFADDRLLIEEFAKRGVEASSVVWRDPGVDWNQFDLALIRSTWDYIDHPREFAATLSGIQATSCRLFNPLEAVRWNSEKHYLLDLQEWGVPTVPTLRAAAMGRAEWERRAVGEGWRGAVLKPVVGAAGQSVRRVGPREIAGALDQLTGEHPQSEFLVQPFIESVRSEGEWSFVYVDGELTHTLLKKPARGDYRAHGIYGGTVEVAEPAPEDARQAQAILAQLPFDLLYARLDLVRVEDRLSVMELELIEPILYFDRAPRGAGRLVGASIARVAGAR